MKLLLYLFLSLFFIGSCSSKKAERYLSEDNKVYSQVLDRLMIDKYYHLCIGKEYQELINNYYNGKIDSQGTRKQILSLKEKRKRERTKCIVTVSEDTAKNLQQAQLLSNIINEYFASDFPDTIQVSIIDFITTPAKLDFKNLDLSYVELESLKEGKKGIGIMKISKIFYNKEKDKAIVYYEFICGGKCGSGEILLLYKINNSWEIKSEKTVWVS